MMSVVVGMKQLHWDFLLKRRLAIQSMSHVYMCHKRQVAEEMAKIGADSENGSTCGKELSIEHTIDADQ